MNTNQPGLQSQKKQTAPPKPFIPHDNPLETLKDIGSGVSNTLTQDVVKKSASSALDALFGRQPSGGDYAKNPFEFPFGPPKKKETPQQARNREILSPARITQEQMMVKQQIDQIRQELILLAKELGQLNSEVQKAVMEVPVDPGIYHLHFFERLKATIQLLRKNVHDSRTWLSLSSGKKKQKGYWGMYKKHGTQFGLSADRTPATQTG